MSGLFSFLIIGAIFYYLVKSGKSNFTKSEKTQQLEEAIENLIGMFDGLNSDIKEEFFAELGKWKGKGLRKYIDEVIGGKEVRIRDIQRRRINQDIGKMYNWLMKRNLEANFKMFNMLKEEHKEQILSQLSKKEARDFEKVLNEFNIAQGLKLSKMPSYLKMGFAQPFFMGMGVYRDDFSGFARRMSESFNNHSFQHNDMHQQMMDHQNFMDQENQRQVIDESWKSVTPFDYGGYIQGIGFNPSDTMAFEAMEQMNDMMQQMDMMNQMDHMNQMNDMHNHHHNNF